MVKYPGSHVLFHVFVETSRTRLGVDVVMKFRKKVGLFVGNFPCQAFFALAVNQ